jgi:hypothetical protein
MNNPRFCCGSLLAEIGDSEANSRKQHFIMPAQTQEATFYCASMKLTDSCPKAEPQEQRSLTLCTLASRWQKQKARSNPYMVTFNFIDYFILVLRLSPPWCYVTFLMFRFLRFYLSAMPSLPLCYFLRTQASFVFFWSSSLLHYSPFDARTRLGSKRIIFI